MQLVGVVNEEVPGSTRVAHSAFADGYQTTKVSVPLYKKAYWGSYTGINVQNVGSGTATVYVVYKGTGGTHNSVSYPKLIAPGGMFDFTNDGGLPNGFIGSATITSDQPIVAIINEIGGGYDSFSSNAFNLTP